MIKGDVGLRSSTLAGPLRNYHSLPEYSTKGWRWSTLLDSLIKRSGSAALSAITRGGIQVQVVYSNVLGTNAEEL